MRAVLTTVEVEPGVWRWCTSSSRGVSVVSAESYESEEKAAVALDECSKRAIDEKLDIGTRPHGDGFVGLLVESGVVVAAGTKVFAHHGDAVAVATSTMIGLHRHFTTIANR